MYKNIELESTKYWSRVVAADREMLRRVERRLAIERCLLFAIFSAAAIGLGYLLTNGFFDNVDIIGPLENFGRAIGIAG